MQTPSMAIIEAYEKLNRLWRENEHDPAFLEAMAAIEQAHPELCDSFWKIFTSTF